MAAESSCLGDSRHLSFVACLRQSCKCSVKLRSGNKDCIVDLKCPPGSPGLITEHFNNYSSCCPGCLFRDTVAVTWHKNENRLLDLNFSAIILSMGPQWATRMHCEQFLFQYWVYFYFRCSSCAQLCIAFKTIEIPNIWSLHGDGCYLYRDNSADLAYCGSQMDPKKMQ